jgi:hypothetical protein
MKSRKPKSNKPIKKKGILIPANNSFEAINRFVNYFPSPSYEELQWALLGIANHVEKLERGEFICKKCGLRKDATKDNSELQF